ncbi:hypothetical protein ARMSODRAFT_562599 [Armillaria solidipes]|uniref:Uncharacterized protein n=1 Tax=Armillaria solidipes TaxID=1076256 RepID=A0A2H3B1P7_9AGAR|nr:hypothetical protein ARMSODRAFT_562599 [Armillaria solidipes]
MDLTPKPSTTIQSVRTFLPITASIHRHHALFSFSSNGITLLAVSRFVLLLPSCKTVITGRRPGAGASRTRLAPIPHLQTHRFVIGTANISTLHSRYGLRFWHIIASMLSLRDEPFQWEVRYAWTKYRIPEGSSSRRSTLTEHDKYQSPSLNDNSSPAHVLQLFAFAFHTGIQFSLRLGALHVHPTPSATFTIGGLPEIS